MKKLKRIAASALCMIFMVLPLIPKRFQHIPGNLYHYAETGEWP